MVIMISLSGCCLNKTCYPLCLLFVCVCVLFVSLLVLTLQLVSGLFINQATK
jgi:hypothetical protein